MVHGVEAVILPTRELRRRGAPPGLSKGATSVELGLVDGRKVCCTRPILLSSFLFCTLYSSGSSLLPPPYPSKMPVALRKTRPPILGVVALVASRGVAVAHAGVFRSVWLKVCLCQNDEKSFRSLICVD